MKKFRTMPMIIIASLLFAFPATVVPFDVKTNEDAVLFLSQIFSEINAIIQKTESNLALLDKLNKENEEKFYTTKRRGGDTNLDDLLKQIGKSTKKYFKDLIKKIKELKISLSFESIQDCLGKTDQELISKIEDLYTKLEKKLDNRGNVNWQAFGECLLSAIKISEAVQDGLKDSKKIGKKFRIVFVGLRAALLTTLAVGHFYWWWRIPHYVETELTIKKISNAIINAIEWIFAVGAIKETASVLASKPVSTKLLRIKQQRTFQQIPDCPEDDDYDSDTEDFLKSIPANKTIVQQTLESKFAKIETTLKLMKTTIEPLNALTKNDAQAIKSIQTICKNCTREICKKTNFLKKASAKNDLQEVLEKEQIQEYIQVSRRQLHRLLTKQINLLELMEKSGVAYIAYIGKMHLDSIKKTLSDLGETLKKKCSKEELKKSLEKAKETLQYLKSYVLPQNLDAKWALKAISISLGIVGACYCMYEWGIPFMAPVVGTALIGISQLMEKFKAGHYSELAPN
ncbi:MAG: hypothetical protein V1855_05185 [bacterium]